MVHVDQNIPNKFAVFIKHNRENIQQVVITYLFCIDVGHAFFKLDGGRKCNNMVEEERMLVIKPKQHSAPLL